MVQFGIILLPTVRVNFGVTMTYYNLFILMTLTWNLEGCSSSKFQGLLTQSHSHDYLLKIRYRHKFHIEQLLGMVTVVRRRSAFFNFKSSHESTNLWLQFGMGVAYLTFSFLATLVHFSNNAYWWVFDLYFQIIIFNF